MPPPQDFVERRAPNPACEAHSISIAVAEERLDRLEEDLRNHRNWRDNMETKVDSLKLGLHAMELRIYLFLGAGTALAWAYEHWFSR